MWSLLESGRLFRPLAIVTASLFVTGVASIGQVEHAISTREAQTVRTAAGEVGGGTTDQGGSPAPGSAGGPASTGDGSFDAGPAAPDGSASVSVSGSGATRPPLAPGSPIPQFGLRTQGVTAKEVKVGYSYNVSQCGDASTLEAMLGHAQTGDPAKSLDAFVRHVNDTGGIAGRRMNLLVSDDGGGSSACPEKAKAAAVKMADEDKVFLAIPGLHVESDYIISRKIPVFGGRDDPASLAKTGPNGLMTIEAIEPTLEKWTAFGKHYLESGKRKPCLIHPESGASGDWNSHEKLLLAKFKRYGMSFVDVITYQEDVSTAQQQTNTIAARAKSKGCDQVYFMAGNPIALIFMTQAATQNLWFPQWTFTSYMVLSDDDVIMKLMDQQQWENAIGLSTRVPIGQHPKENNCKRIYERYYPDDGRSEGAYVKIACAQILSVAEAMRRAVKVTGVLTADSLLVGADAVRNDFFYDAHVPMRWSFPGPKGPFKTKAFSHYTVVDWSSQEGRYLFPEYPKYWEVMGPGKSNAQDLRPTFRQGG